VPWNTACWWAGIAVAVMAAIYGIGTALNTKYNQVQTQLGGGS
jgi:Flp pilus assembly pilin Flp